MVLAPIGVANQEAKNPYIRWDFLEVNTQYSCHAE
jgi:hypothetical protein